jgi:N6-adenosine-specific RNA methylase IME4
MKYKTVVIDPPWKLTPKNLNTKNGGRLLKKLPYKTMSDEEITNFNINDFADKECNLFLWCTNSKIPAAIKILEKWGFRYSTFMVWNKNDGICHNGFHYTLEFVIYGYRGYKCQNGIDYTKPLNPYFEAKRYKHSEKPSLFYAMLSKVTPAPRIDIFARKRHYGFDAYGDQVETQMQVPLLLSVNP